MGGCSGANPDSSTDYKKLVENGALVVDVRTDDEFSSGHIDGALHIPYEDIEQIADHEGVSKDTTLVLYCRSGRRSGIAKDTLDAAGYTNVYNAGGYGDIKSALGK